MVTVWCVCDIAMHWVGNIDGGENETVKQRISKYEREVLLLTVKTSAIRSKGKNHIFTGQ